MGAPFFVSPQDASTALSGPNPPVILDVRRRELIEATGRLLPASRLAAPGDGPMLAAGLGRNRPVLVACAHGHDRSQRLAAGLRAEGFEASTLAGGFEAWIEAGLPTVRRTARGVVLGDAPTVWVTRRRPKIDRVACPWLVSRYLDPCARFLFVEPDQVLAVAAEEGGIPYDLPGGLFEHEGDRCTFTVLVDAFGLCDDAQLAELAKIVEAADTDRLADTAEAAGLLAVSLGLSARFGDDDQAVLRHDFVVYDALLAWLSHARHERHFWARAS